MRYLLIPPALAILTTNPVVRHYLNDGHTVDFLSAVFSTGGFSEKFNKFCTDALLSEERKTELKGWIEELLLLSCLGRRPYNPHLLQRLYKEALQCYPPYLPEGLIQISRVVLSGDIPPLALNIFSQLGMLKHLAFDHVRGLNTRQFSTCYLPGVERLSVTDCEEIDFFHPEGFPDLVTFQFGWPTTIRSPKDITRWFDLSVLTENNPSLTALILNDVLLSEEKRDAVISRGIALTMRLN